MVSWLKDLQEEVHRPPCPVELMVTNTEMRQLLWEDHLRKFPDFQRLSAKFGSNKASLQDMYKVYVAVSKLDSLISCLQDNSGEEADNFVTLQDNFIKDLQEANKDFDKFQQMVETTIDLKQVEQGHFMIRPGWLLTIISIPGLY